MNQRDFKLILSILTGLFSKFFSVISIFITIPITLDYLGPEKFGLWMLISGVLSLMTFSDLGIGMGLQNAISKSVGENNKDYAVNFISTAYYLIFTISTFLLLVLFFIYYFSESFSYLSFLGLSTDFESVNAFFIAVIIFLIGMPVNLIQRVLNGYQKMYISNNLLLCGQVLSFFTIFAVVYFDLKIIGLITFFFISPIIVLFCYSVLYFLSNENIRPRYNKFSRLTVRSILKTGGWTVLTQLIYTLKINSSVIIVSMTLGLVILAEFTIAHKLITVVTVLVNIAIQSLWPVYGEAYAKKDKEWIEKTIKKSLIYSVVISLFFTSFIILFNQYLLEFWVGEEVEVELSVLIALSVMVLFGNINICYAVFLNGTNHFKLQSIYSLFFVFIAIVFSYNLAPTYGLTGVVLSIAFFSEILRMPFFYWNTKKILGDI